MASEVQSDKKIRYQTYEQYRKRFFGSKEKPKARRIKLKTIQLLLVSGWHENSHVGRSEPPYAGVRAEVVINELCAFCEIASGLGPRLDLGRFNDCPAATLKARCR